MIQPKGEGQVAEPHYVLKHAAEIIGVSERLMRSAVRKGHVRGIDFGTRMLIPQSEVRRLIKELGPPMDLEQELKELVTAAREGGIPLNTIIKVLTEETVALTSEELEETDAEDEDDEDTPPA